MITFFQYILITSLSFGLISCSASKGNIKNFDTSLYEFKVKDKQYFEVRNVGGHKTGGDRQVISEEELFLVTIPSNITKSSFNFGKSFTHNFFFSNGEKLIIIDNMKNAGFSRKDSMSRNEFLSEIDTLYELKRQLFNNKRMQFKKCRSFGIMYKGSFMICYINVKSKDIAKFNLAFNSFLEMEK